MLQGKMAKSKTLEGIESMAENVRNTAIVETEQVGTKRLIIKTGTLLLIAKSEREMRNHHNVISELSLQFPDDWQRIIARSFLHIDKKIFQILMLF